MFFDILRADRSAENGFLNGPAGLSKVQALIKASFIRTDQFGIINARVERLTWDGHEFLEASRNESIWNQAKSLVMEKGGGMVFTVLKEVLLRIVKANVLQQIP